MTVAAGGASIRWYEFRNTGGGWLLHQEETYAPDSDHRWNGSIAMNGAGDIMMGYSVSSGTTFPDIRYVGRQAGDPLSQMTLPEISLEQSVSGQVGSNRWGDYSSTVVDPADDFSFWHTNYWIEGPNDDWHTWIGKFQPDTAPPLVDITVTPSVPVPIIIPAGGTILDMTVTVDNNSGSTLNAQVWNTVTLLDAGGEEVGPVGGLPVIPISVPDGGQFSTTFSNFEFPGGVPTGNYAFNWKVGTFPNLEFTRDSFAFSKAAGPTLTKAGDDDWGLSPAKEATVPEKFSLEQNYPNPFNPETEIRFQLPEASQVVLKIFNTLGQEIRTLTDREYEAGFHRIRWDGKDSNGNAVSSGIYLYQLQAGSFSEIRKMTLLR